MKTKRSKISNANRLAHYIATTLIPANPSGFTLDPIKFQAPILEDYGTAGIYLVSLKGYEEKFNRRPILGEVSRWIKKHTAMLSRPGHYIGGWQHAGIYYLDISIAVIGKAEALRTAYDNEQLAIYDLSSEETVHVPRKLPLVA